MIPVAGFQQKEFWNESTLRANIPKEPSKACKVSYDQISEILQHHFHQTLSVNSDYQA